MISLCCRYCYAPIGIHLGIKHVKHSKVVENKELEKLYKSGKKMSHKELEAAAKQEKMTERQVERWLRVRRAADRPTKLKKFCENSFRFTYYVFSFIFGLVVLWDKPWLWNIKHCWYNYPHQVSLVQPSPSPAVRSDHRQCPFTSRAYRTTFGGTI